MSKSAPILLSFYGLSNGTRTVVFGKLAYTNQQDLSFKNYSKIKTFSSIIALYRARSVRNQTFTMTFDHGTIQGHTDAFGSFWCEMESTMQQTKLLSITLTPTGIPVQLTEELYPNTIQPVNGNSIVISDLDDTLIDSFVQSKFKQLKTLLLTTVEKRTAVISTAAFIRQYVQSGANAFYLSNSEQNLYPMLFRFLKLNNFPAGPLFLRQYINIRHWAWRKISRQKNIHKRTMLEKILELFPQKKFILVGDNTQHDLSIYLDLAQQYPANVEYIFIRKVRTREADTRLINHATDHLQQHNIKLYYGPDLPDAYVTQ